MTDFEPILRAITAEPSNATAALAVYTPERTYWLDVTLPAVGRLIAWMQELERPG